MLDFLSFCLIVRCGHDGHLLFCKLLLGSDEIHYH